MTSLLLPDVPPIADTADLETVAIRQFLQQTAVMHNALVNATLEQFQEQRRDINTAGGQLTEHRAAIEDIGGQLVGVTADISNTKRIVNSHNKDMAEDMDKLVKSADAAALAATIRLSRIELEVSQFAPGAPKTKELADRMLAIEAVVTSVTEGLNTHVDSLVTNRLNTELGPQLKAMVADSVASENMDAVTKITSVATETAKLIDNANAQAKETAKLVDNATAQAQAVEAQRVSGQDLVNRLAVAEGQIASLSNLAARGAPVRDPPGMAPATAR